VVAAALADASEGEAALAVGNAKNKHAMNKKEAHISKPCLRHVCFDVLACFVFMKFPNKLARRKTPLGCR